ncbi:multicopper oxidase domain-containing protein, partial [Nocardia gipuzkoensis]
MVSRRGFLAGLAGTPLLLAAGCARPSAPATTATRPLPVPPLAQAAVGPDGTRRFMLEARTGASEIVRGKTTPTWGYNGAILGPTLRARRGEAVACMVHNHTPEPTTLHWHGMH